MADPESATESVETQEATPRCGIPDCAHEAVAMVDQKIPSAAVPGDGPDSSPPPQKTVPVHMCRAHTAICLRKGWKIRSRRDNKELGEMMISEYLRFLAFLGTGR